MLAHLPRAIRQAATDGDIKQALRLADEAIEAGCGCPCTLVLRGVLIQLQDQGCHHGLAQAEADFLGAHTIDNDFLPAIEELAHYYDAVRPDPEQARQRAEEWLRKSDHISEEMRRIATLAESTQQGDG